VSSVSTTTTTTTTTTNTTTVITIIIIKISTRISCRRITANVLQTKVDAQCDKLATELS